MQCPNCGRTVRSKTHCAFCGYKFNAADKKEFTQRVDSSSENDIQRPQDLGMDRPVQPISSNHERKGSTINHFQPTHQPVTRRNLSKELEEAEKEAEKVYAKTNPIETRDEGPLNEEDEFKRRADEVLAYPYAFIEEDPIEDEDDEDYYVMPPTKARSGGFFGNLLKLLLGLAFIFLLFLYGPVLMGKVMDYFNPTENTSNQSKEQRPQIKLPWQQESSQETSKEVSSQQATTVSQTSQDQDVKHESQVQHSTLVLKEDQSQSQVGQMIADESQSYQMVNTEVDLKEYPKINIKMEFAKDLANVDRDTFKFKVKYNSTETELKDAYSLTKEGKKLILSYLDPAIDVVGEDTRKQSLMIQGQDYQEAIAYELPKKTTDKQVADDYIKIMEEQFKPLGKVSASVINEEKKQSFVYDNETVEADSLIAWFVLQRTYELVKDGDIRLDDSVEVNKQLMASGDQGVLASGSPEEKYTIQSLIDLVIQQADASAMNHLVQVVGGVNEFNYWLNGSGYFSTRMSAPLAVENQVDITGATTSASDISQLLTKLAHNKLISEDLDKAFKEALLQSPMSEKFPNENAHVKRRFELLTKDTTVHAQHYAGIIETDKDPIILVLLSTDFEDSTAVMNSINQTISKVLDYQVSGSTSETTETSQTTTEPVVASQVEPTPTTYAEVEEPVATTHAGTLSPSGEPVDNLYEGKQTENFYWFGDEYRRGTWHQTPEGGWVYY